MFGLCCDLGSGEHPAWLSEGPSRPVVAYLLEGGHTELPCVERGWPSPPCICFLCPGGVQQVLGAHGLRGAGNLGDVMKQARSSVFSSGDGGQNCSLCLLRAASSPPLCLHLIGLVRGVGGDPVSSVPYWAFLETHEVFLPLPQVGARGLNLGLLDMLMCALYWVRHRPAPPFL